MMGYVSVLLKISYQQFRVNPHGVNSELASIFEKIVCVRSLVDPCLECRGLRITGRPTCRGTTVVRICALASKCLLDDTWFDFD